MTLNEHVWVDTTSSALTDRFYPENGYALYEDDDASNINPETGEILCYWTSISYRKINSEERAPHIFAKLIDETMQVFGNVNQPAVMALSLEDETDTTATSHTYIDENGVEKPKTPVF